jgi:hypothetical protein
LSPTINGVDAAEAAPTAPRPWRNHVDDVHDNPVKHGHVSRPRDWPWSSFARALTETPLDYGDLPEACPWTQKQILGAWWPENPGDRAG